MANLGMRLLGFRIDGSAERWAMPGWLSTIVIVLMALAVGAVLILVTGANPVTAYRALVVSAFGSVNGFAETMVKACPLLLAGLGVTVAYRARADLRRGDSGCDRRDLYYRAAGDHPSAADCSGRGAGGSDLGLLPGVS